MAFKVLILTCLLAVTYGAHLGLPVQPSLINPLSLEPRVVGGRNAEIGEFPYQVAILRKSFIKYTLHCGGSILSETWILTAGHCVGIPASKMRVQAGKNNIAKTESFEQTVDVEEIFMHKKYPGGGVVAPYDIALLKLKTPLEFNKYVQPIKLPAAEAEYTGNVTLSGWGSMSKTRNPRYPSVLQTVELPIVSFDDCNDAIISAIGNSPLHETNICTGPLTGGYAACSGDSGGPLASSSNGKKEVVGIVSWGMIPCGARGMPSVFVKVSSFISWINGIIEQNS